jgi:hypothetical protein
MEVPNRLTSTLNMKTVAFLPHGAVIQTTTIEIFTAVKASNSNLKKYYAQRGISRPAEYQISFTVNDRPARRISCDLLSAPLLVQIAGEVGNFRI